MLKNILEHQRSMFLFPPAEREKKGHFGLSIMEERAKALDAEINFLPNTPTGLIVNFRFRTAN